MNIIKSEVRKTFSIRSTWIYLIVVVAGIALVSFLPYLAFSNGSEGGEVNLNMLTFGIDLVMLVAVFGSAMIVGSDAAKGTLGWTYLSTNARTAHALIQTIVVTVSFLSATVVGILLSAVLLMIMGADVNLSPAQADTAELLRQFLNIILFPLIAGFLAQILRSGVFAAMIVVADAMVIEGMLGLANSSVIIAIRNVLPARATQAAATGVPYEQGLGWLVIAVTVILFAGGAAWAANRRGIK